MARYREIRMYLPVTPVDHGDVWNIRTVLTEEQGAANIAMARIRQRSTEGRGMEGHTLFWILVVLCG